MMNFSVGVMSGLFLTCVIEAVSPLSFKPNFDHAHDAFVCNGTICRDKMSVLPVAWRRYVSLP